ncbi:hypothetical protein RYX36_007611 [Vicia faba]
MEDGELCEYHKKLERGKWDFELVKNKFVSLGHSYELIVVGIPLKFILKSLKKMPRVLMFVVLYNIRIHSHMSSIPVETVCLLYYILEGKFVDVARRIANKLKRVALSGTRHGDQTSCQLTYPRMIMGLCKKARVPIPIEGHQVIKGTINENY